MELLRVRSSAATGLDWHCGAGAVISQLTEPRSSPTVLAPPSSQGIQAWAENRMASQELGAWVAALGASSDTR